MANFKFVTGVLLGAAAGAALAMFLQSEKGKEIIDDIKSTASDATDSIKDTYENIKEDLADLLQRAKNFAEDLESRAKESLS